MGDDEDSFLQAPPKEGKKKAGKKKEGKKKMQKLELEDGQMPAQKPMETDDSKTECDVCGQFTGAFIGRSWICDDGVLSTKKMMVCDGQKAEAEENTADTD